MGYDDTTHNISLQMFDVEKNEISKEEVPLLFCQEIRRQLEELSEYEFEGDNAYFYIDCSRWYDADIHLTQVSKNFPHVLICQQWDGEESDDKGEHFYLNGIQSGGCVEIIYPEFDPSKHFQTEKV